MSPRLPLLVWLGAVPVTAGVLVVSLRVGGGLSPPGHGGLLDAGDAVRWGLPAADLAVDLTATAVAGLLLCAAVLLPNPGRLLSPAAVRAVRLAGGWALAWALAAAAQAVLTVADLRGVRLRDALGSTPLHAYADVPQARELLETCVVAAVVAGAAVRVRTHSSGALLLVAAVGGLLPTTLTGHAVHAANVRLAAVALAVHVGAAALWAGGLGALVLHVGRHPDLLAGALTAFSRVALGCFVAVAASGVLNTLVAVDDLGELVAGPYGLLVLLKVLALGAAGAAGALHRSRAVPRVLAGRPHSFLRLASVECLVMGVAFALAVALSRTAAP